MEDNELVRPLGREDGCSLFGPLAQCPTSPARPGLLAEIAETRPVQPARSAGQLLCLVLAVGDQEIEHATAYVAAHADRYDFVQDREVKDDHTAPLIGNLEGSEYIQR
ncbi:hypothetical protein [Streptomyces anulatus]|uniref:hypothetical protein n=1 Tax=Streptomyces anulatus TaxID=1892 RepID=UPI0034499D0B